MFPYRLSSCVAVLLLMPVAVGAKLGEGVLHEMAGPEGVLSLAYSPDGKRLAAQTSNGICIWDTTIGREVCRIAAVGGWSAVFSPDGKTVYAPLQDLSVGAWDVATSRLVKQFKGHTSTVWSAAISPDGKRLASGGEDGTVRLWDTATGKELFQLNHTSGVWPVLLSPDGKQVVSVASDGNLHVWDATTGKSKKEFATEASTWPLALSSDGKTAATVIWQQTTLRLWDLATGDEIRTVKIASGAGWNAAFTPNGRMVAAGGPANTFCLWEAMTGQERLRLKGHDTIINAVACAPDGRTAASASSNGKVIIWDITGRLKDGRLVPAKPTAAEQDALWKDLSGHDGMKVHRAIWTLTAAGNDVVSDLAERLRKAVPVLPDAAALKKCIAALDDNDFEVREKASAELDKLGVAALPPIRKALERKLSPEQRRRLTAFVQKYSRLEASPEILASRRAVEALEQIGTPEARAALEQVLKTNAAEPVVQDARVALRRLAR